LVVPADKVLAWAEENSDGLLHWDVEFSSIPPGIRSEGFKSLLGGRSTIDVVRRHLEKKKDE
jgi:hypothetical protein